jgi:hypothetical protein
MTWIQNSYVVFVYLGIFFFITHFFVYGSGIDISYFGLFLILIGYFNIPLYNWVFVLLWIFIIIEFYNLGKIAYYYFFKNEKIKKRNEKKLENREKKEKKD